MSFNLSFLYCLLLYSWFWLLDKDASMVMHAIVQVGYITRFNIFVTYTATGTMETGVLIVKTPVPRDTTYTKKTIWIS